MTGSLSPLRRWLRSERARENHEYVSRDAKPLSVPATEVDWLLLAFAMQRPGGLRVRLPRVYYMDGV